MINNFWFLVASGLLSGLLAGLFGIGGGMVLVPLLITLNYTPVQAVATSSLAIIITSVSGSWQNWRMGYLKLNRVILLGFPALITAQIGVYLATLLPDYLLLTCFGILLIINVFLGNFNYQLLRKTAANNSLNFSVTIARLATGGTAGFLAGLFGIGGGAIMVPLQMLLLNEPIKIAIQTSLGVIVITAISSTIGHSITGNVLFGVGLIVGFGGLIGAQISTRFLPKLPDQVVRFCFYGLLTILAIYTFWKAWNYYQWQL